MTEPTRTIIEYRNVTKSFGDRVVLDDVSCKIAEGRTTVIIGPSGVGKSVFIKLLVGLLPLDAGSILLDGRDVSHLDRRGLREYRRTFGMLFQDGALFDTMTVEQNVAFPLRRHTEHSDEEIAAIVARKLEQVGLAGEQNKFPGELSGGMRKRAAFARAIALEPRVVVFDEPNSGLDPIISDQLDRLILRMKHELGITFVVISHDIISTMRIADTVGALADGKLIAYGSPEEVWRTPHPMLEGFYGRYGIDSEEAVAALRHGMEH